MKKYGVPIGLGLAGAGLGAGLGMAANMGAVAPAFGQMANQYTMTATGSRLSSSAMAALSGI